MKKIALLTLLFPVAILAQFNILPLFVDYAVFNSSDTAAYVEIYVSTFQGYLKYNQEGDVYTASFTTQAKIGKDKQELYNQSHAYSNSTQDTSLLARYNQFVDIYKYELPFGNYTAKLTILDNNSTLKGELELNLDIKKPKMDFHFSDIQICTKVERDATPSIYLKNGLQVFPHPRKIFDVLQPMLYFYVELNGLPFSSSDDSFYNFGYYITNSVGDTIRQRQPKKKKIYGPTMVEVNGFNVMALPKDHYFLNLTATTEDGKLTTLKSSKFSVYKRGKDEAPVVEENNNKAVLITGIYSDFTKEALIDEFDKARYISTAQENQIFKNLETKEAMISFLAQFWARRDKAAMVSPGIFRDQFMDRVRYANDQFRYMGKDGWKSDRGRVFIIYGEPDELEREPNTMDQAPSEIWHFHTLEGGSLFIFGDINGFGEYELLHSTYRKELQNPSWRDQLRKDRSGSSNFETY